MVQVFQSHRARSGLDRFCLVMMLSGESKSIQSVSRSCVETVLAYVYLFSVVLHCMQPKISYVPDSQSMLFVFALGYGNCEISIN